MLSQQPYFLFTLIEFAEFEVKISMGKICNFDSNLSAFNSVDVKKAQQLSKDIFFAKAKIFKFYDFFTDLGYFEVNYSGKVIGLSKKAIRW